MRIRFGLASTIVAITFTGGLMDLNLVGSSVRPVGGNAQGDFLFAYGWPLTVKHVVTSKLSKWTGMWIDKNSGHLLVRNSGEMSSFGYVQLTINYRNLFFDMLLAVIIIGMAGFWTESFLKKRRSFRS